MQIGKFSTWLRGLKGQLIYALADNVAVGLFSAFYVIALARLLPEAEFGLVVLFDLIRNLAVLFAASVGQAVVKFFASPKDEDAKNVLGSATLLLLAYWVGISVVIVVGRNILSDLFHAPCLAELLVYLPVLLLVSFSRILFTQLNIARHRVERVLLQDLTFLGLFVAMVLAIHATQTLGNAYQVVHIFIVARLVDSFVGLFLTRDLFRVVLPTIHWLRQLWGFSKHSFVNLLGTFSFSRVDTLLLGILLSPVEVAAYSAGAVVFNFFMLVSSSTNMLVFPLSSSIVASADSVDNVSGKLRDVYARWTILFSTLSMSFVIPMLLFASPISMMLYGNKYPETPSLIRLFALWGISIPISRVAASILNGMGLPKINARYTWISGILSAMLNLALIPLIGLSGAALASVLVALAIAVLYMRTMSQRLEVRCRSFTAQLRLLLRDARIMKVIQ